MKTQFIKTDNVICQYCEDKHPVDLNRREAGTIIKNRHVWYVEYYYYCHEAEDEFQTSQMYLDNMDRARQAYDRLIRTGKNLLITRG